METEERIAYFRGPASRAARRAIQHERNRRHAAAAREALASIKPPARV
jgi:hypothetical protein